MTAIIWMGFQVARRNAQAPCDMSSRCTVFLDYLGRDPYCVVDPTCVSPFYNPDWESGAPHWQGFAWLDDRLLSDGNGFDMLAPFNYILFMLLAQALTVIFVRRGGKYRAVAMLAILLWCLLEIVRWLVLVVDLEGLNSMITIGFLMILLASFSSLFLVSRYGRS